MADDNANAGSLALLRQAIASKPLDISDAPAAAGYGSAWGGLLGQAVKSFQAHQIRTKAIDLLDREELARKFEKIANDPRYGNDPDIQLAAEQHANTIRMHEVDKKLDKDYQPDKKDGTIPALNKLLYTWHTRETKRKGGPPAPEDPKEPTAPDDPGAMMVAPFHPTSFGPPPAAAPSPSIAATPGGVQEVPGSVSPGPAVPGVPATPSASTEPYGELPAGIEPPPSADSELGPRRMNDMQLAAHQGTAAGTAKAAQSDAETAALVARLRKLGVPEAEILRVVTDATPGVNNNFMMRPPQTMVIRKPDGNIAVVQAKWTGSGYINAMTGQPVVGEPVGNVHVVQLGDRVVFTDGAGNELEPKGGGFVKALRQTDIKIHPITGDIIQVPVQRNRSSTPNERSKAPAAPSVEESIPPPPAAGAPGSTRATTKPASSSDTASASSGPLTLETLLPGDDPVSINARQIANGNGKISDIQGNAGRWRVQSKLDKAGVILINDKQREALSDSVRVLQLTGDIRSLVSEIQNDPMSPVDINTLNDTISSVRSLYAKGTFREAGMLSEGDVRRSGKLLPGGLSTAAGSAIDSMTGEDFFKKFPLSNLDELERILRRGIATSFRGRKGQWLQGLGVRSEIIPTATPEIIHEYAARYGNNAAVIRAKLTADGWEIPKG